MFVWVHASPPDWLTPGCPRLALVPRTLNKLLKNPSPGKTEHAHLAQSKSAVPERETRLDPSVRPIDSF